MAEGKDLRQAIEALAAAANERLARHPLGHLLAGRRGHLELDLRIPLGGPVDAALDDAVAAADEVLTAELEALVAERSVFRPGRVYCLRCASSDCEHASPGDGRKVFAGYGSSGLPLFADFAQWLLERQHPHLDRIYQAPPRLVTEVVSGRELLAELLPIYRDRQVGYHVHGQVNVGWYRLPAEDGKPESVAVSLQVLSSAGRRKEGRGRRRLVLNVLASGPGGEPLERLYDRLADVPWKPAVQWGQEVLQTIESSQGKKGTTPEVLSRRIEGLLAALARRLEQGRRSRDRRTGHAEERHHQGDRPTRMAMADLERAAADSFFTDERRGTTIVLGERGRAHVWSDSGKLVTSIRYSPESIERKQKRRHWRPATAAEAAELRKKVGVAAG